MYDYKWREKYLYLDDKEAGEAKIDFWRFGQASPLNFHFNFTYSSTTGLIDPPSTGNFTMDERIEQQYYCYVNLKWDCSQINSDITVDSEFIM